MRPIKNESNNVQNTGISLTAICYGTLATVTVAVILSTSFGVIYFLTSISESTLPWVSSSILCVSAFLGSIYASQRVGAKGLYHGIGVGIMFFIFIWIVAGFFLAGNLFLTGFITKLVLTLLSGAAGGVLGVSFSSK
ncbi:MAG: TIGR04086 family membrane protein [Firmicutes bacterium]|nr:TIGR04086 family membrane protein [Bacillota bacterium]